VSRSGRAPELSAERVRALYGVRRLHASGIAGLYGRPALPLHLLDVLEPRRVRLCLRPDGGDGGGRHRDPDAAATEVLRPAVLERPLDLAVAELRSDDRERERERRRVDLTKRVNSLEGELANLAEVAAQGGAVPAVLDALRRKDAERLTITRELATVQQQGSSTAITLDPRALRQQLRAYVDEWQR
jgi:hypothetical protein